MAIPEINKSQVELLVDAATGLGAFSIPVPDMKLDDEKKYNQLTEELCDFNQLVILGLFKDISDQCGEMLAKMYAMSKREFRVFEITDVGKKMFGGPERTVQ